MGYLNEGGRTPDWKMRTTLIGSALGAIIGVAAALMFIRRSEECWRAAESAQDRSGPGPGGGRNAAGAAASNRGYGQSTVASPSIESSVSHGESSWSGLCRITIHYPNHVHPIWSAPRIVTDALGNVIADCCLSCHSPADAAGAVRVPAGQLDLSGGPSPDEADHLVSYRELLFTDNAQEANMGALQDILVPGPPDPVTGQPTLVPVPVNPSMSAAGARASTAFFSRFAVGGTHAGWLTPAELRLISEWLDIGGQYYNDPFMAPVN